MLVHENQEHRNVSFFGFSLCFHWLSIFITLLSAVAAFFPFPFLLAVCVLSLFSLGLYFFLSILTYFVHLHNFGFFFLVWYKRVYSLRLKCDL